MHIWQGCGVVIKNKERKRGEPTDISSRKEMGGVKENLFLSTAFLFVDYDGLSWNVDYRELIGGYICIRYNGNSNAVNKEWNSLKVSEFE